MRSELRSSCHSEADILGFGKNLQAKLKLKRFACRSPIVHLSFTCLSFTCRSPHWSPCAAHLSLTCRSPIVHLSFTYRSPIVHLSFTYRSPRGFCASRAAMSVERVPPPDPRTRPQIFIPRRGSRARHMSAQLRQLRA